jgi:pyruvate dehydrogenase (quinone)/pyruvate oxidase
VHTHTQQDVELDKLFMDVCVYNARVMGPAHVENVMQLACRTAASRHGVAHVTMPVDMQSLPLKSDARSARNVRDHASMVGGARHRHPVRRAAPAGSRNPGGRPEDLHSRRSECARARIRSQLANFLQ